MTAARRKRPPHVAIIAAVADNGVIGRDDALPWRLSDDLRRFKSLTLGHPVVMGRRTYESMGRPLPGRHNLVLSRSGWQGPAGVDVFPDLGAALAAVCDAQVAFILGGRRVFECALPIADRLHLTRVHAEVEGDTRFPEIDMDDWLLQRSERHRADARNEFDYTFADYLRAPS